MSDHDLDHDHNDGHHHADGHAHGSVRDYTVGFVLSVILTAIPFYLVMNNVIQSPAMTGLVIMSFAVIQIIVHMVYFLHMNSKSEGGWNMLSMMFTMILLVITLSGSIWVMYHLNGNLMPAMSHEVLDAINKRAQ